MGDELRAEALPPMGRGHGHGIDPAAMTIVAGHHSAHYGVSPHGDEEEVIGDGEFLVDGEVRPVMRGFITEDSLPERDDLGAVDGVGVEGDGGRAHDKIGRARKQTAVSSDLSTYERTVSKGNKQSMRSGREMREV